MNITLETVAYSHRSSAAHLLTAKATKLADLLNTEPARSSKEVASVQAGIALYDMALVLQKPYDPNYTTVINWKCLALVRLGQFEEAVKWYREIIRITQEVDGSGTDATMQLALIQRSH
jgi:tetratricopeptide (TPR) repeat protein